MPNYFTMKMREGTQAPDNREKVIDFLTKSNSIGIGEEDFTTGAGTFLNDIQIGDIIVLRAGGGPVALLKVVSDSYEYKSEGKFPAFDNWLAYARKVEVISWYDEFCECYPGFTFDARGYMQTCAAITGDNLPVAQKWYEETMNCSNALSNGENGKIVERNYDKEEIPGHGVEVTFQPTGSEDEDFDEENCDAEEFDIGVNTFSDYFDEDEEFEVESEYTAWYVIGKDCFTLNPGTYRFHEGEMQVWVHDDWKRYRHDEDDF